ncbi:hypothetical protein B0H16DRAFT_1829393 [Mycena metata]|uniref:Uncharacterized protein n=1 Tax=Mycena metata TaxID=1033252 RepID=A0AAD7GRR5_9AGAR|nr:hypothetical protein B0H16DRAFT_1829393 [Mycena metata]
MWPPEDKMVARARAFHLRAYAHSTSRRFCSNTSSSTSSKTPPARHGRHVLTPVGIAGKVYEGGVGGMGLLQAFHLLASAAVLVSVVWPVGRGVWVRYGASAPSAPALEKPAVAVGEKEEEEEGSETETDGERSAGSGERVRGGYSTPLRTRLRTAFRLSTSASSSTTSTTTSRPSARAQSSTETPDDRRRLLASLVRPVALLGARVAPRLWAGVDDAAGQLGPMKLRRTHTLTHTQTQTHPLTQARTHTQTQARRETQTQGMGVLCTLEAGAAVERLRAVGGRAFVREVLGSASSSSSTTSTPTSSSPSTSPSTTSTASTSTSTSSTPNEDADASTDTLAKAAASEREMARAREREREEERAALEVAREGLRGWGLGWATRTCWMGWMGMRLRMCMRMGLGMGSRRAQKRTWRGSCARSCSIGACLAPSASASASSSPASASLNTKGANANASARTTSAAARALRCTLGSSEVFEDAGAGVEEARDRVADLLTGERDIWITFLFAGPEVTRRNKFARGPTRLQPLHLEVALSRAHLYTLTTLATLPSCLHPSSFSLACIAAHTAAHRCTRAPSSRVSAMLHLLHAQAAADRVLRGEPSVRWTRFCVH